MSGTTCAKCGTQGTVVACLRDGCPMLARDTFDMGIGYDEDTGMLTEPLSPGPSVPDPLETRGYARQEAAGASWGNAYTNELIEKLDVTIGRLADTMQEVLEHVRAIRTQVRPQEECNQIARGVEHALLVKCNALDVDIDGCPSCYGTGLQGERESCTVCDGTGERR